jgi:hypothetical protein
MMATMVTKDGSDRTLPVTGGALFGAFGDIVATAMTKFGPGDEFNSAIRTELHILM